MRIISGKYRGRRLNPPAGLPVRPTTDFARESLFNVLNNLVDFEGLRVLDLFAGTGSVSFEFLSRGAAEVTAIDANNRCIDFIRKSGDSFGIDNLRAVRTNAFVFLRQMKTRYDLIFADPPYDMEGIADLPRLIRESELLDVQGWFILEHSAGYDFREEKNYHSHRRYGSVNFSFFRDSEKREPDQYSSS